MTAGRSIEGLALVEAVWARLCEGTREDGTPIERYDPHSDDLQAQAKIAKHDPRSWISMRQYYGNLSEEPRFADAFERWLRQIWAEGLETAIQEYLGGVSERRSPEVA